MKLPTIKDIALEAGVNKCVVSHVLHDDAYAAKMRPETRQRILDIAAKLHYIPNQLASATSTGKVNTIALISNFSEMQGFHPVSRIITGIMMESAARRYSIKIFDENELELAFRLIAENRIGKVISTSVKREVRAKTAELAEKYSLDLVFAYERGHGKFPAVNTDNVELTSQMVHYLAGHGHTRIALLCVPHWAHYVEDRHAGYLRGMTECGLNADPRWIACSDETERSVENMLSLPVKERPTGFIALSDIVAANAQRTAWERGLKIPEDFSIVGIGDTESSLAATVPLTTFRENFTETGKLLVRLILGEKPDIAPDEFNVYHTHAELVERKSVFNIKNNRRSK
ncbi:MAG: LacI family transcriptional regulator [Lentisphaerae bacterium]|nr:LacI family transcriptional regulator [Lentisphaerota bacterium]